MDGKMKNLKQEHEAWINSLNKVKETEPKLNYTDRQDILKKAYQYKNQHPDEFVRILAQIAIYHYGD